MSAFDLKQHWDSRKTREAVGLKGPLKETLQAIILMIIILTVYSQRTRRVLRRKMSFQLLQYYGLLCSWIGCEWFKTFLVEYPMFWGIESTLPPGNAGKTLGEFPCRTSIIFLLTPGGIKPFLGVFLQISISSGLTLVPHCLLSLRYRRN